jgi:uncharacterized protein
VRKFLLQFELPKTIISHIENIIRNVSFSSEEDVHFHSRELEIIKDADRLDAMGAIGIARAFHYGGYKGRPIYNPAIQPDPNMSKEEYKQKEGPTINHFYEKLLLLKDQMNTAKGKEIAEERHHYMEEFLRQFYEEWGLHE